MKRYLASIIESQIASFMRVETSRPEGMVVQSRM